MARQITMQKPGARILQNYNTDSGYIPLNSTLITAGGTWYHITRLDLRGLNVSDRQGVILNNIVLQEDRVPGINPNDDPLNGVSCTVVDCLMTYAPDVEEIAEWPNSFYDVPLLPGFLPRRTNSQVHAANPNQVVWGLWRTYASDTTIRLDDNNNLGMRQLQSGFFGEGNVLVSPFVYWVRVLYGDRTELASPSGGVALVAPSANLVMQGVAVELSEAQEVSQMMRGSGR